MIARFELDPEPPPPPPPEEEEEEEEEKNDDDDCREEETNNVEVDMIWNRIVNDLNSKKIRSGWTMVVPSHGNVELGNAHITLVDDRTLR